MNAEFLQHYERELQLLYEGSKEFAEEFPGVAERLGELVRGQMDPGLAGLLEGAAFMAARVQLKLKSEFSEFTAALIDQVVPSYLAPIPSSALVQALPRFEDPNLVNGLRFLRGSRIDAIYVEQERRVSCRFTLRGDLEIWPLHLEEAAYFASPAPLQMLGLETGSETAAGLKLTFRRLTGAPGRGAMAGNGGKPAPLSALPLDGLTLHLTGQSADAGPSADAISLYEQLFARCRRVTLRFLDARGDARFLSPGPDFLRQVGFDPEDATRQPENRMFSGFEMLRDFFAFPARFMGFRLQGLRRLLAAIPAPAFDVLFEFDAVAPRLASVVGPGSFALYAVPVSNLFEMECSRMPVRDGEHEHHVSPDRSRTLDFEAHEVTSVFAHYAGGVQKVPVYPLYSLPEGSAPVGKSLFYSVRRVPRRQNTQELRTGRMPHYTGTELFLSLYEPAGADDAIRVRELSVRAKVSNRHLAAELPVGEAGADFVLTDNTDIVLRCLGRPTLPRESLVSIERRQSGAALPSGRLLWRIVNFLSLSHLGLTGAEGGGDAQALRELLSLFADLSDLATERRIRGVESVQTRPVVRRLRQKNGFNAARGLEVTVTLDEKAFEGTGIFLLGAALDRFFAEYSGINSFTETVVASRQRGIVKRWPPRGGLGRPL